MLCNKCLIAQTSAYLKLAKNIGNEKTVRAVASINGTNMIGIMIPSHRIIGSNGNSLAMVVATT